MMPTKSTKITKALLNTIGSNFNAHFISKVRQRAAKCFAQSHKEGHLGLSTQGAGPMSGCYFLNVAQ